MGARDMLGYPTIRTGTRLGVAELMRNLAQRGLL